MKVLYFHQHFSTPGGSTGLRSYEMARRLLARGHRVTMVCGSYHGGHTGLTGPFVSGERRGYVDGIDVIEFDLAYSNADGFFKRTQTFLRYALRSVAVALSEPCDVVFATSTPLTAGIPGIMATLFRRRRFVFEVRDLWPELPRSMGVITNPVVLAAMSGLEWVSYHSATRVIALAPGIKSGIQRRGIPPRSVDMIPNGCDLGIFHSAVEPWRPNGVGSDDFLALFTGSHGVANGLDAVLDAGVELLRRGRTDIKILLIGQGRMKPALMDRAKEECPGVVLFHDPVDKPRLAGLLAGADAGLQILANVEAFYYGTSPNKFFDYIAAGLPVLVNYPGWLSDLIQDQGCGIVVPPGDAAAFADALEALADDRDLLLTRGGRARALAESEFDRIKLADKWVDCMESVMGSNAI